MLQINNLAKSFGNQDLFDGVQLQMNPGERLGLVGRNGCGKSTLFRIILGQAEADSGNIRIPKNYQLGHLEQHIRFTQENILEEARLGLAPEEREMTFKVERILLGLGFNSEDFSRSPQEFSGGFQIRINLAKLLLAEPNLLLLDEPTNYLDILSIRWLTRFLKEWPGELMLISHDRSFMDDVCTHTAILHRGKLRKLEGNTEKLYAQILQDEEIHEKTRANQEKKLKKEQEFIDRFRAKASKATAVQSRIKRLEKLPSLEKLAQLDQLDFAFTEAPFAADRLCEIRELGFHYEPDVPLIADLSFPVKKGDRIGVIGKNGKGKSTFLRLMAQELTPLTGEIYTHPDIQTGYFGQTNIQRLHANQTIEGEIASVNPNLTLTKIRNIAATMMFSGDQAEKKISVLSGGEKSRVLLGKILAQPCNLLLLDEPTNHLDMESIEALVESLRDFAGAVLIVTHSEQILRDLATHLLIFQRGGVEYFPGTYTEFLEKRGWEDDGDSSPSKKTRTASPNKKELRKRRSEILQEKSKALAPLQKNIEALEKKIVAHETELAKVQNELTQVSLGGNNQDGIRLNQQLKNLQWDIEKAFGELSEVHKRWEKEKQRFETLLEEETR